MSAAVGTTAQWPLQVAVATALEADAAFAAAVGADETGVAKVYDGQAPGGTALDYVVLGDATEVPGGAHSAFGRGGHSGALTLHLWTTTRARSAALHAHMARVLDGQRLTVAGHAVVLGRLSLANSFTDPSGAHHRVLRYETLTRPVAS